MALQLFKLVMNGVTNTVPTELGYFTTASEDVTINSLTSYTLLPDRFVDDDGVAVTSIIPAATSNGYYTLFIDGTLTQSSMYTVGSAAGVTIGNAALTQTITILASSPITLAVTNFAPTTAVNG
ncbi:DUF4183 domain-containing protein [Caproiciproducens faecalis]|uniref:DUF4183 domain-containing protein n=1 Tax=Caproiciproducens faecalis TaxID=2820301 RepID=A0ABS7DM27_9FIRM|nr:DUF4183 domain-containing protein [Caproiciproducens faecalis]MBW7572343.1 DUF4183 domain-containing protein [Caproiciproducens faecalis]